MCVFIHTYAHMHILLWGSWVRWLSRGTKKFIPQTLLEQENIKVMGGFPEVGSPPQDAISKWRSSLSGEKKTKKCRAKRSLF